jgi:hypothetical protein
VFVLRVMTHREYDRDPWKEECGCYSPPPKKRAAQKPAKKTSKRKPKPR